MDRTKITMYSTWWCIDCRRAMQFLKERGVEFHRYFSCTPSGPYMLSEKLNIPLNS